MSFVEIDRINCIDEQGNEYIVIVHQNILSKKTYDGLLKSKGRKIITLSDGQHVNMIGHDYKTFQILNEYNTLIKAI